MNSRASEQTSLGNNQMNASKSELREEWAEKVWLPLEFWMRMSRVSPRDFDVDRLKEVVSKLRRIPTFEAYREAAARHSQPPKLNPYPDVVALFRAPSSGEVLDHPFEFRRLLAQWQRET